MLHFSIETQPGTNLNNMNFSKRYKFIAITKERDGICATIEQYQNPRFLHPKQQIKLNESQLWKLDREYFSYITSRQDQGMWAISPESISLLKTHDELHKGFLEIRRHKHEQGMPFDVEVNFA